VAVQTECLQGSAVDVHPVGLDWQRCTCFRFTGATLNEFGDRVLKEICLDADLIADELPARRIEAEPQGAILRQLSVSTARKPLSKWRAMRMRSAAPLRPVVRRVSVAPTTLESETALAASVCS